MPERQKYSVAQEGRDRAAAPVFACAEAECQELTESLLAERLASNDQASTTDTTQIPVFFRPVSAQQKQASVVPAGTYPIAALP